MSTIPNPNGDLRRAIEAIIRETPPFDLGDGTTGYTVPDDADITGAGTVTALRAQVALLNQVVRGILTEQQTKGFLSPRGRPS